MLIWSTALGGCCNTRKSVVWLCVRTFRLNVGTPNECPPTVWFSYSRPRLLLLLCVGEPLLSFGRAAWTRHDTFADLWKCFWKTPQIPQTYLKTFPYRRNGMDVNYNNLVSLWTWLWMEHCLTNSCTFLTNKMVGFVCVGCPVLGHYRWSFPSLQFWLSMRPYTT